MGSPFVNNGEEFVQIEIGPALGNQFKHRVAIPLNQVVVDRGSDAAYEEVDPIAAITETVEF